MIPLEILNETLNQSINTSSIYDLANQINCQILLSSKEALAVQSFLFCLLGVILLYEIIKKIIPIMNKKFYTNIEEFNPSVNKLFFLLIGYFLVNYFSNYGIIHIVFFSVGLFIMFYTESNKIVDNLLWKLFKFKTKKVLRMEKENLNKSQSVEDRYNS